MKNLKKRIKKQDGKQECDQMQETNQEKKMRWNYDSNEIDLIGRHKKCQNNKQNKRKQ